METSKARLSAPRLDDHSEIITFIYWLMLLGLAFSGLAMLVSAFGIMKYQAMAGMGMLVLTPIALLFGALADRIGCVTMIVLLKINEAVQEIRSK